MTYSQWFIAQNLLCETPYFMGELAWKHQQDIINRLQMALADTEALEVGTAEKVKQLQTQLESEKVSHEAWEKQSLLEYSEIVQERDAFESDISTIAQHNIELMQERDALRDALERIVHYYDLANSGSSLPSLSIQAKAEHENTMFGEARKVLNHGR